MDSMRDTLFQAWPAERRRLKALIARNEAFIESVLTVTGKRVFVDTSKDNLRLNALHRYSSCDIRAIHLMRDARGVVASRLQRRRGVDTHEAARQWAKIHQRVESTVSTWPEAKRNPIAY